MIIYYFGSSQISVIQRDGYIVPVRWVIEEGFRFDDSGRLEQCYGITNKHRLDCTRSGGEARGT